MSKQLLLLRHGKSDWKSGAASDHERPLAARGVRAAEVVGRLLTTLGQSPDAVISSSAVRALTTAKIASAAGAWKVKIESTPDFYMASPNALLDRMHQVSDSVERLLLVGHEPTWSDTVSLFIGQADVKMVTGALARIDLPIERWTDARFGCGTLSWMVTPKIVLAAAGQR